MQGPPSRKRQRDEPVVRLLPKWAPPVPPVGSDGLEAAVDEVLRRSEDAAARAYDMLPDLAEAAIVASSLQSPSISPAQQERSLQRLEELAGHRHRPEGALGAADLEAITLSPLHN